MSRSIPWPAWLVVAMAVALAGTGKAQPRNLDIYWVDVEGGAATLMVSPSGESLLYDSGWEVGDRDAKRIAAVAQQAGLKKIDDFVLSHFHADHAGGITALAKLVPIGRRPKRVQQDLHRAIADRAIIASLEVRRGLLV